MEITAAAAAAAAVVVVVCQVFMWRGVYMYMMIRVHLMGEYEFDVGGVVVVLRLHPR